MNRKFHYEDEESSAEGYHRAAAGTDFVDDGDRTMTRRILKAMREDNDRFKEYPNCPSGRDLAWSGLALLILAIWWFAR